MHKTFTSELIKPVDILNPLLSRIIIDEVETCLTPGDKALLEIIAMIESLKQSELTDEFRQTLIKQFKAIFCQQSQYGQLAFITVLKHSLSRANCINFIRNTSPELSFEKIIYVKKLFDDLETYFKAPMLHPDIKTKVLLTFRSNLSEKQLKWLYKCLIMDNFIDDRTSEETFIKVFSGVPISELNGEKIIWIDCSKTRPEPNGQTIFELLFLLKEFLTKELELLPNGKGFKFITHKDSNNVYTKINNCFNGCNDINQKNPDSSECKPQVNTPRKKKLKEFADEIKLIK